MEKPESVLLRAWKDTVSWLLNSIIAWILVTLVGGISTSFIPAGNSLISRIWVGVLGAAVTIMVIVGITYLVHLLITPYRQRNEALKQRDESRQQVNNLKDSYAYALSLDGLGVLPESLEGFISLKLSNNSDNLIQIRIDETQTYIEIDGVRLSKPELPKDVGGNIAKSKAIEFILPYKIQSLLNGKKKTLHYEMEYGRPGQLSYRQIRDLNLVLGQTDQKLIISYTHNISEDKSIPPD